MVSETGDRVIDFAQHLREVRNCKVINGESVAPQQRLLVVDSTSNMTKKKEPKTKPPKIKWWKLKEPFLSWNSGGMSSTKSPMTKRKTCE
jgi:hypothetical protein